MKNLRNKVKNVFILGGLVGMLAFTVGCSKSGMSFSNRPGADKQRAGFIYSTYGTATDNPGLQNLGNSLGNSGAMESSADIRAQGNKKSSGFGNRQSDSFGYGKSYDSRTNVERLEDAGVIVPVNYAFFAADGWTDRGERNGKFDGVGELDNLKDYPVFKYGERLSIFEWFKNGSSNAGIKVQNRDSGKIIFEGGKRLGLGEYLHFSVTPNKTTTIPVGEYNVSFYDCDKLIESKALVILPNN